MRQQDTTAMALLGLAGVPMSELIEGQEKHGHGELVNSSELPIKCPREQLEKLGFNFGEPTDDLFIAVFMPGGWTKKATDHSMWTDLLDHKGRKRGSIFYKAAFYDRDAFMHLIRRYTINQDDRDSNIQRDSGYKLIDKRHHVFDNATDEIIHTFEGEGQYGAAPAEAVVWLEENYPLYNDSCAYWDGAK